MSTNEAFITVVCTICLFSILSVSICINSFCNVLIFTSAKDCYFFYFDVSLCLIAVVIEVFVDCSINAVIFSKLNIGRFS